jgi:hypothetical protein
MVTMQRYLALFILINEVLQQGFVAGFVSSTKTRVQHSGELKLKSGTSDDLNFEEMLALTKRLDDLESSAPDIMLSFYEPHLKSFSVKPGSGDRLSVTSTCYSLQAVQTSSTYDSMLSYQETDDEHDVVPVRKVIQALLASKWREDDLFQVPLLLYTILRYDTDRSMIIQSASSSEESAAKIRQLITAVLNARPQRRNGERQVYSDYITYQVCSALAILQENTVKPTKPTIQGQKSEGDFVSDFATSDEEEDNTMDILSDEVRVGGLPSNAVPDGAAAEISLALARCAEVGSNELCRQLAYRAAGDSTSFDVIRLAYSLLSYITSTQSLSGVAGRELIPGQGVAAGTQVTPLNKRLVVASLAAFFAEQNKNDGLWDKGQPIYQSFRKQGRNVGNAFVFAVDTVGSLLESLPAEYFRPHLKSLEMMLKWIEGHQTVEVIPDYCDPASGECYGKALRGWNSPHLRPDTGPQAWSTAQVLRCISLLKTTIEELMHADVLEEFNGIAFSQKGIKAGSWDRLLDTDLGSAVANRTIKSVLEERFIVPFASSINNPSYGAAYSAILHGEPVFVLSGCCHFFFLE